MTKCTFPNSSQEDMCCLGDGTVNKAHKYGVTAQTCNLQQEHLLLAPQQSPQPLRRPPRRRISSPLGQLPPRRPLLQASLSTRLCQLSCSRMWTADLIEPAGEGKPTTTRRLTMASSTKLSHWRSAKTFASVWCVVKALNTTAPVVKSGYARLEFKPPSLFLVIAACATWAGRHPSLQSRPGSRS